MQALGDGRGQGRLAMIDVANGADVHMLFGAFEFGFGHKKPPSFYGRGFFSPSGGSPMDLLQ
jgi:hypothetical protein